MTWIDGEIITATRLEDKADKNKSNGYAGLGTNLLVDGSIISNFNLLKIAHSSSIFTLTQTNSGTLVLSNSGGTAKLTLTGTLSAKVSLLDSDLIAISTRNIITTFKIDEMLISSNGTLINFGLSDSNTSNYIFLQTSNGGGTWGFKTYNGTATVTSISAIQSGNLITFTATPTVASAMKNNSLIARHTTNIPIQNVGRYIGMSEQGSSIHSSYINLSFLS